MDNLKNSPFSSALGDSVYRTAKSTVLEYGMEDHLGRGVVVGLSGGADSVLLLYFLLEYRSREMDFPIVACHVNHGIRGDEANRDERFSRDLARLLGVEFVSVTVDVPKIAAESSVGIEEAARNARYTEFERIISGRNDVESVAVAHNATDNLETVLFNVMRGTGARGAAGIAPVRENIIRPLIDIDKRVIHELLDSCGIPYVTDSTNLSTDYTRNFLRNNVIEQIRQVLPTPERSVSRLSRALRADDDYIFGVAKEFLDGCSEPLATELLKLHSAVLVRVIVQMAARCGSRLESVHINDIVRMLSRGGDFELSVPGSCRFVCERGRCSVSSLIDGKYSYLYTISEGKNEIAEYGSDIFLTKDKISLNIYKNSIQADISSAIICGELYVRPRKDGDTVFYSGHTHKIKKIFCDLKIPKSLRDAIPILCDDRGVVWVPGVAVRDDSVPGGERAPLYASIGIGVDGKMPEKRFYTAAEFRINKSAREDNK